MKRMVAPAVAVLFAHSPGFSATAIPEPPESLRYDQTAWICTHNAMSNAADGWWFPNQNKNIREQFADGVRAFMLDVHVQDGALVLRHGPSMARILGWRPLAAELSTLHALLQANPRAIVTVILESYAPARDVAAAFRSAGLEAYAYTHRAGEPWPSLGELIRSGHRLVVFTDRPEGAPAWQMSLWNEAWETPFSARAPSDLLNVPNRGNKESALLILNHFCAEPLPSRRRAAEINSVPFLTRRLAEARSAFGRDPNFLTVDFYDVGDVPSAVAQINAERAASR